jgi:hypothetical protein
MNDSIFDKLKVQLEQESWPNVYLFKFIVPNDPESVAKVNALFSDTSDLVMHPSRNGKYISLSVKELMLNVESIIAVYEKASLIQGIISL